MIAPNVFHLSHVGFSPFINMQGKTCQRSLHVIFLLLFSAPTGLNTFSQGCKALVTNILKLSPERAA